MTTEPQTLEQMAESLLEIPKPKQRHLMKIRPKNW